MADPTQARLIYLVSKYQIQVPRKLLRLIPGGEWVGQLALGLGAAASELRVPLTFMHQQYEDGESMGPGTDYEGRLIIAELIVDEIEKKDLNLDERLKLFGEIERFINKVGLIEEEEVDLSKAVVPDQIPKWDSGFLPLDVPLGGMYQGLGIVMARPGTGKTSVMLSLMESLVMQGIPVLFVESEIPKNMMLGRMKPIFSRVKFKPADRLICASWSSKEVLEYCRAHPDTNRVVFYDGPDVMVGGDLEDRRHTLERAYQDMVVVKGISRMVVVSSQPRRKDETMQMTSVAESWAKAWYADWIAGLQAIPGGGMRFRIVKNRFGPRDQQIRFNYNLEDLTWNTSGEIEEDDW